MSASASRVTVAGGGPAAVEALLALRKLLGPGVQLELIAPNADLIVRPYEVLAPFHEGRERRYPLARIAADVDVRLVRDSLASVDADAQELSLHGGPPRPYDALIVAVGGRQHESLPGTIPFRGSQDSSRLKNLLMESHAGRHHQRVAFVVPSGHTWPLPLYELALQTAAWLAERGIGRVPLAVVSPEHEPLAAFGSRASDEVSALLTSHGIEFITGHPVRVRGGRLLLAGGRELDVSLAIAMARIGGPRLPGLPCNEEGFVLVEESCRVDGVDGVFAAGDATAFPVKQGGIATQQADAVAELLAAELGVSVRAGGFRPVLRAVLFAGRETRYLYAELGEKLQETSSASTTSPWPESSKLVGRYLSPYLDTLEDNRRGSSTHSARA